MSEPKYFTSNSPLINRLIEAGVIPKDSFKWSVISEAGGVVRMVSECFIAEEQFQAVADAILDHPECIKSETIVASIDRGKEEWIDVTCLGDDWRKTRPRPQ